MPLANATPTPPASAHTPCRAAAAASASRLARRPPPARTVAASRPVSLASQTVPPPRRSGHRRRRASHATRKDRRTNPSSPSRSFSSGSATNSLTNASNTVPSSGRSPSTNRLVVGRPDQRSAVHPIVEKGCNSRCRRRRGLRPMVPGSARLSGPKRGRSERGRCAGLRVAPRPVG